MPPGSSRLASPCASVDAPYTPNLTSTFSRGAWVFFSLTLTVTRCSAGLAVRKLKEADSSACGNPGFLATYLADHEDIPSVAGAASCTSATYNALVPGQGVSPSVLSPMRTPASCSRHARQPFQAL